ncbi:RDD family protein [Pedobacter sp. KACC 23697]|uniref:RDD family protein n=1 Tax=Pedobacter sp. KACC 23697 TaxID=3149230 RepID=A0AAU7K042_9SPHI
MHKFKSKLALFIILTAVYSLTVELLPSFLQIRLLQHLLTPFSFSFRIKQVISYETLSQIFTALFLISGVLYYVSKGKESRLVTFLFSVILIDRAVRTFNLLMLMFFSFGTLMEHGSILLIFLSFIGNILWAYLSLRILKDFKTNKKLQAKTEAYGEEMVTYLTEASNWQRIFHLVVDSLILVFIFYPVIEIIARIDLIASFFNLLGNTIGEKPALYLIFGIFRLIYYVFFEKLFQSSPAKFLTETRLVTNTEGAVTLKTVFVRTASRFVPFDGLSFVFANAGWHDKWSETSVVREERSGAKGWKYFFIIPIVVILFFVFDYTKTEIHYYIENRSSGNEIKDKIDHLTVDDFIEFRNVKNANTVVYLKPENIKGQEITYSLIGMDNDFEYHPEQENIDAFYLRHKNTWPSVTINKDKLMEALPDNFERAKYGSVENNGKGIAIKGVYGNYIIKSIEAYMQPILALENISVFKGKQFTFSITNKGWKVKIIKIEMPETHINWVINDSTIQYKRFGTTISGFSREPIDKINAKLTVQDTVGKTYFYDISARLNSGTITKIK